MFLIIYKDYFLLYFTYLFICEMKINSHPEKKLEGILKQEILFKSAKKMMKELSKIIETILIRERYLRVA